MSYNNTEIELFISNNLFYIYIYSPVVDLDLPVNQVLAFFNKTIRKITNGFREMLETQAKASLSSERTLAGSRMSTKSIYICKFCLYFHFSFYVFLCVTGMQSRADSMGSLSMSLKEDQLIDQKEFEKMVKAQKNLIVSLPRDITKDRSDLPTNLGETEIKKKKKKKNKNSWQPKGSNKKAKME